MDGTENSKRQKKSVIHIKQDDITTLDCECIVNAANNSLLGGGGVDGAIHRASGPELLKECRTLGGCKTGEAKITHGYNLPATWVIHTVGPVYSGQPRDAELLANCYRNSLELAKSHNIHSMAFPAISTGSYRYPLEKATAVAMTTVKHWLDENSGYFMEAIFCCFSQRAYDIYQREYSKVQRSDNEPFHAQKTVHFLQEKKIFISHRSTDKAIADMLLDFFLGTGIPRETVFCSSLPGNDINEKISGEVKAALNRLDR